MTDFKFHLNSRKRKKAAGKWQSILAIIVTVFLITIISFGFLRGVRLKGGFAKSIWDGSSPIAIVLDTNPASILVFQKDSKKVIFLAVPSDVNYATGDAKEPVKNVFSSLKDGPEGGRKFLTRFFGAKIAGYVKFNFEHKMDKAEARQIFKDFAFLTTPISIIFNGLNKEVNQTNLSRVDMLKLWWQVKGISLDDLDYINLDKYAIDIIGINGESFKGLDRDVVRQSISSYFEDIRVEGKHIEIEILNTSGESGMGTLASDIAETYGFDVDKISSDESISDKTKIIVLGDKSDVGYLAKLFDCDIYRQQNESGEAKITLQLGRDFAEAYRN